MIRPEDAIQDPADEAWVSEAPETPDSDTQSKAIKDALGSQLVALFEDAKRKRQTQEDKWANALRHYKGVHDPEVEAKLKGSGRSRAFVRVTKIKVDTIVARLQDLIFPANDKSWAIEPTPVPYPHPEVDRRLAQMMASGAFGAIPSEQMAPGQLPPEVRDQANKAAEKIFHELVNKASDEMAREMDDQLGESPTSRGYASHCRDVSFQAVLYGTGVLKGPLSQKVERSQWQFGDQGWNMQAVVEDELKPFYSFVPIWTFYPDPDAVDIRDSRYLFESHLMGRTDLLALADREDFDGQSIREYVQANRDGSASIETYEREIRSLGDESSATPELKHRYRVLEFWGFVSGEDLLACGCEGVEDPLREYSANVWVLGNTVIKAELSAVKGVRWPYFMHYFNKDETSIWGEGVASVGFDMQRTINAAFRAMLDNAAVAAGGFIACNMRSMAPGEDPTDIYPFKVFKLDQTEGDVSKAFQVYQMPSYTQEFIALQTHAYNIMDELTTPRFMHGDARVPGAGQTASGLSMLMGAANVNLKDLVKQWDEQITVPFITALYHWNMENNPKPEIKGDFGVVARGSSVIAKEIKLKQLLDVVNLTNNPRFASWIKDEDILKEVMRHSEMNTHLLRTAEEHATFMQQQAEMAAMAQERARAQADLEAIMSEAQKQNIPRQMTLAALAKANAGNPNLPQNPQPLPVGGEPQ